MSDADRMNALVRECHEYKAQRDAALAGRAEMIATYEAEIAKLKATVNGLAERVAAQADLLSRRAEKNP